MFVLRAIVLIKILHILNNLISKVVHAVKALNRPCTRGTNSLHSVSVVPVVDTRRERGQSPSRTLSLISTYLYDVYINVQHFPQN